MSRAPKGAPLAFLRFVQNVETDCCVLYPFSTDSGGYGLCRYQGRLVGAHRLSLILSTGQDPEGLDAAHAAGIGCSRAIPTPDELDNLHPLRKHRTRLL